MERIITLFDFLSSYVVPSRWNGRSNGDSIANVEGSNNSNGNSADSGFHSSKVGLKDAASVEKKVPVTEASPFSEPGFYGTSWCEVREIKSPNASTFRSSKVNFSSGKERSDLPPVNENLTTSRNVLLNNIKVIPDGKETSVETNSWRPRTDTALPKVHRDPRKELLSNEQQQTGKLPANTIKDNGKNKGFPNILSNVGKSLVEINQLTVFDRTSLRKKRSSMGKEDFINEPIIEVENGYESGQQPRTEEPRGRKSKKKKKDKGKGSAERSKEKQLIVGKREGKANECVEKTNHPAKEHVVNQDDHTTAKDRDGVKPRPSKHRPGTGLGKWFKKHRGTVAPAPLDDRNNGVSPCLKLQEEKSLGGDTSETHGSCPFTAPPNVKMVFMTERQENVSVLIVKDDPLEEAAEVDKVDNEVSKKSNVAVLAMDDKPSEKDQKMEMGGNKASKEEVEEDEFPKNVDARTEQETPAKQEKEEDSLSKKTAPPCFSFVHKKEGLVTEDSRSTCKIKKGIPQAAGLSVPRPMKRNLLNETVDNICLVCLNDGTSNQPKVSIKKKLSANEPERGDFYIEKSECMRELASDFEHGLKLRSDLVQTCKTVPVKQPPNKISVLSANRATPPRRSLVEIGLRPLPIVEDFLGSETFEIKDNIVNSEPLKARNSPKNLSLPPLNERGILGKKVRSVAMDNPVNSVAVGKPKVASRERKNVTKKGSKSFTASNPESKMFPADVKREPVLYQTFKKPQWDAGKPCLPSIKTQRTQLVEDFHEEETHRQHKFEFEDEFEDWEHDGEEPDKMNGFFEKPVTAKTHNSPVLWKPVNAERPLGRKAIGQHCFVYESSSEGSWDRRYFICKMMLY